MIVIVTTREIFKKPVIILTVILPSKVILSHLSNLIQISY